MSHVHDDTLGTEMTPLISANVVWPFADIAAAFAMIRGTGWRCWRRSVGQLARPDKEISMRRAILFRFALAALLSTSALVVPAQSGQAPSRGPGCGSCVIDANCSQFQCPFCVQRPGMPGGRCCTSPFC